MPIQLPRSQGPQVDPQIPQAPRVSPTMDASNFGGGRAADQAFGAARGLAGDVMEITLREEMRAQEAQANELDVELGKLENQSRDSLYQVQGGGALGAQQKMLQDYDKQAQEVMKRATSERVREKMANAVERRRIALEGTTKGYVRGQMLQHEEDQAFSRIQIEEDAATQAYQDPLRIQMALDEQATTLKRYGALSGKPPEWVQAKTAASASRIHNKVVDQYMSAGNDIAAKRYFDANKDEFLDQASVRAKVEESSYLGASRREEERIATSGKSEKEMYAMARAIEDDKLAELTERRLDQRIARDKRAAAADYSKAVDGYVKRISEKWMPANASRNHTVEDVIGPGWSDLETRDQKALTKLFRIENGLEAAETDNLALTKLNAMSREELARMTPEQLMLKFRPSFTDEHYRQYVLPTWNHARDPQSAEKFNGLVSDNEMMLHSLAGAGVAGITKGDTLSGITGEKADPSKAEMFGLFKRAVDVKLQAHHTATGKNADDKKKKEIVEGLALEWGRDITLNHGYTSWGRGYSAPREHVEKLKVADFIRNPQRLKDAPIVLAPETQDDFFRYAQSVPALLPRGMSKQQYLSAHRDRVNLAYLAKMSGADDVRIAAILEGK